MAASKWDDRYYLKAYVYAKSGMTDTAICGALGVTPTALKNWERRRPALTEALAEGRKSSDLSFREFVYGRLSPQMKEVWDRINLCESSPNGVVRVEEILAEHGTRFRQHLFMYALVDSNFNPSVACSKVNVSYATLQGWKNTDPEFGKMLVEELHWHKGNFFEEALFTAVREGEPTAVIFANKTFNKDRGYGEKLDIKVEKTVTVEHRIRNEVTIKLDTLPLEKRKQILYILREAENASRDLLPVKGETNGEQVHGIGDDGGKDGAGVPPLERQVFEVLPG